MRKNICTLIGNSKSMEILCERISFSLFTKSSRYFSRKIRSRRGVCVKDFKRKLYRLVFHEIGRMCERLCCSLDVICGVSYPPQAKNEEKRNVRKRKMCFL